MNGGPEDDKETMSWCYGEHPSQMTDDALEDVDLLRLD
jgi:hypothetical protein